MINYNINWHLKIKLFQGFSRKIICGLQEKNLKGLYFYVKRNMLEENANHTG